MEGRRRRLSARELRIGWKDSEYAGLGGSSPLMQNGLGTGAGGWLWWRGWRGRGFCGEFSHINVTPSHQHSRDIKRQGSFILLPASSRTHRYLIFTSLLFTIISWFSPQDNNLQIGLNSKIKHTCQYSHQYIYFSYCLFSLFPSPRWKLS